MRQNAAEVVNSYSRLLFEIEIESFRVHPFISLSSWDESRISDLSHFPIRPS